MGLEGDPSPMVTDSRCKDTPTEGRMRDSSIVPPMTPHVIEVKPRVPSKGEGSRVFVHEKSAIDMERRAKAHHVQNHVVGPCGVLEIKPRGVTPRSSPRHGRSEQIADEEPPEEELEGEVADCESDAWKTLPSCLVYVVVSTSFVFVNKGILETPGYIYPVSLLFFQNSCATILLHVIRIVKIGPMTDLRLSIAKKWNTITMLYVWMIVSGVYTMYYLPIPLLFVYKNFTLIGLAVYERYMMSVRYSFEAQMGLVITTTGAFLCIVADPSISWLGYFWSAVNSITTIVYMINLRLAIYQTRMSEFGATLYNNTLSLPLLFSVAVLTGEFPEMLKDGLVKTPALQGRVLTSGILTVVFTMTSFWCARNTSPAVYSLTGSVYKIPLVYISFLLFEFRYSWILVLGVTIALFGSLIGSVLRYKTTSSGTAEYAAIAATGGGRSLEAAELGVVRGLQANRAATEVLASG